MFPLKVGNDMDEKPADENLVDLFQQWLSCKHQADSAYSDLVRLTGHDPAIAEYESLNCPLRMVCGRVS